MFGIEKIAIALIAPLGSALALGLVALLLALCGLRRLALLAGTLSLAWATIWSLPAFSLSLRGVVEAPYPYQDAAALPRAPIAVVLGGGIAPAALAGGTSNLNPAADRVVYAAQLYHAGRTPRLLVSGGADAALSAGSEAAAMAELLEALGVPPSAIIEEPESRNTRQNAAFSAALLREKGIDEILLVTSALHMRRAQGLFEAEGLTVHPAATDHEARVERIANDWLPSADALHGSARALKELVGRWTGR